MPQYHLNPGLSWGFARKMRPTVGPENDLVLLRAKVAQLGSCSAFRFTAALTGFFGHCAKSKRKCLIWCRRFGTDKGEDHMRTFVAAAALASILASPTFGQSFDPSVGSGNLATGLPSIEMPRPPVPATCETRRVQFSNEHGWGARDIIVCCTSGRCFSYVPYKHQYGHPQ
jgi:hypothetical protein